MNNASNGPMLKATPLWSKTSVKGGQYLTGRLGGVKVLILENREPEPDGPTHSLFFVEAPDHRQQAPQDRADGQRVPGTPRTPQNASGARRSGFQGHQAPLDYNMPDAPEWARS